MRTLCVSLFWTNTTTNLSQTVITFPLNNVIMIAIVNVGPHDSPNPMGERTYEVRINQRVITTFKHERGDGLSVCLQKAAKAVELESDCEVKNLFDFITSQ